MQSHVNSRNCPASLQVTVQLNVGNANLVPVLENELQQSTSNGALQVRNPHYSTTAGLIHYQQWVVVSTLVDSNILEAYLGSRI